MKPAFRYDIQALRALAVLAVLFFHFKVPLFQGGFIGVDIFFVISGYLMSSMIMRSQDSGRFSLIDFYGRRAKRIIPELLFMILTVTCFTFFIYLPIDFEQVAKNATASLLFYANIQYAIVSYFDAASDNNIFLHTWSLSVEWQFYLLFPLLLLFLFYLFKGDKKKYFLFFSFSSLVLFLITIKVARPHPTFSFYSLATRSWELLTGTLVYLLEDKAKRLRVYFRKAMAICGYSFLLISITMLKEGLLWPSPLTLLPLTATAMVLLANTNNFTLLKLQPVQLMGKLSYSVYLWHWPLLVIANYLGFRTRGWPVLNWIALSIFSAYLTYTLAQNLQLKRQLTLYATAMVLALMTSGFAYWESDLGGYRFTAQTLQIANYARQHLQEQARQFNLNACYIVSEDPGAKTFNRQCLDIVPGEKNLLLIGDSHAAQFSQSLRENLEQQGIHLLQASATLCLPVLHPNGATKCTDIINYTYQDFIPQHTKELDGVIISALWMREDEDQVIQELSATLAYLQRLHIPTVILGETETYTVSFPSIAAREYEYHARFYTRYMEQGAARLNRHLKKRFQRDYVDIFDRDDFPKLSPSLAPYMMDKNHFTKYGADMLTKDILNDPLFRKRLGLDASLYTVNHQDTQ